jgi:hypothetical protein
LIEILSDLGRHTTVSVPGEGVFEALERVSSRTA